VKGSFWDVFSRALLWNSTPPLYFLVLWPLAHVFGFSELLLRLPSVIFSVGTAAVLYRLAQRWLDREGAAFAVLFFFCLPTTQFFVVDARPYALGLLLLACTWLMMMRWLETGSGGGVCLCGVQCGCSLDALYACLGLAAACLVFAAIGMVSFGHGRGRDRGSAAAFGAPLCGNSGQKRSACVVVAAGYFSLGFGVLPPSCLLLLFAGGVMSVFSGRPRTEDFVPFRAKQSLIPVLLLAASPPVLLFLLSRSGALQLFTEKYMVCKDIGVALLAGWTIRGLAEVKVRRATIVAVAVLAVPLNALIFPRHGIRGCGNPPSGCARSCGPFPKHSWCW